MNEQAILLTDGLLTTNDAKTAHGLIRGTDRYTIAGVVDAPTAGQDAGAVLDGQPRGIPIFSSVEQALATVGQVSYAIVAVATSGGILPPNMLDEIKQCLEHGLSVVNGLHEFLNEKPDLVALAHTYGGRLIDVRRPKPRHELHFWTGEINQITAPIIAIMGTDCALGKRTTARLIQEACNRHNLNAQMIYTGQTGWLQGVNYGFIFDSTLNDFVSGELEHALLSCWRETSADVLLIEGQASLRNPSGPCGSEFLVSGNARHVVLVHAPKRTYYDHIPAWGSIHSVESEIELIRCYGSSVIALALNTEDCSREEAFAFQKQYADQLGIPVLLPLEEGVSPILPILQALTTTAHAH
ncbi:DUF1611 domain-containing protein [Spirosoma radiotolerans]|uniref:Protein often near L-alanine-DL-glutamate epimerase (Cell wall recycling) n=1 Tax=Spirosoma radiotolerans TaxID=1379870 RepID=A0A0E3ZVZ9_9BACT|nr:DUF1611 domain-containing protein [Spirosoma radiotolerans]AKD55418.1 protein often near L-alanine-DL-glutamate epimerase (cell wall recycling) [Spirosoma radiotolerans]